MTAPDPDASPPAAFPGGQHLPGVSLRRVWRHAHGSHDERVDVLAEEIPVAFAINGVPFAVMMASPGDLEDFATGFALSEGLVGCARDVAVDGIQTHLEGVSIALRIPQADAARIATRRRALEGRSGCGICGSESIEAVLSPAPCVPAGHTVPGEALAAALHALQASQPLNARTGATHAAAFVMRDGALRLVREDVGRHNALDKLVGAMARAGLDPACGFALVTSRASYEMVLKAARGGFPLLAAISAPTALAVALAEHAGMTLVGFARETGHVVYAHPWRVAAQVRVPREPGSAPV